jgi:hypothetical protein
MQATGKRKKKKRKRTKSTRRAQPLGRDGCFYVDGCSGESGWVATGHGGGAMTRARRWSRNDGPGMLMMMGSNGEIDDDDGQLPKRKCRQQEMKTRMRKLKRARSRHQQHRRGTDTGDLSSWRRGLGQGHERRRGQAPTTPCHAPCVTRMGIGDIRGCLGSQGGVSGGSRFWQP